MVKRPVRVGEQEQVYGTVESTPQGNLRYHPETPETRGDLLDFIKACRSGQDNRDGALYCTLPADEFLRRLPQRFSGYAAWGVLLKDGEAQMPNGVKRAVQVGNDLEPY